MVFLNHQDKETEKKNNKTTEQELATSSLRCIPDFWQKVTQQSDKIVVVGSVSICGDKAGSYSLHERTSTACDVNGEQTLILHGSRNERYSRKPSRSYQCGRKVGDYGAIDNGWECELLPADTKSPAQRGDQGIEVGGLQATECIRGRCACTLRGCADERLPRGLAHRSIIAWYGGVRPGFKDLWCFA